MDESQAIVESRNARFQGYRVCVKGCLGDDLLEWLDFGAHWDASRGETSLFIPTHDQAVLYGAILHLRDMGLTLISVERVQD